MRIELASLEEGHGDFDHTYQPLDLKLDDEQVTLCGATEIRGKIKRSGREVVVDGHIDSCVQVNCDRCLKVIQFPVSNDFSNEYITGGDYEQSQVAELSEDLMSVSVFDGETIDLDEVVKEQLLLGLPARALCKSDCLGICPDCGNDRNAGECGCEAKEVDPRWSALKDLMSGKS